MYSYIFRGISMDRPAVINFLSSEQGYAFNELLKIIIYKISFLKRFDALLAYIIASITNVPKFLQLYLIGLIFSMNCERQLNPLSNHIHISRLYFALHMRIWGQA